MNSLKSKVMLIGIDGAELAVFEKMIDDGFMPNLKSIYAASSISEMDGYVDGPGQGWASIVTGKSPRKHGVYYWTISSPFNSVIFDEPKAWNIMNDAGFSAGVMNVSYTFPPEKVNGFMISGLGAGLEPSSKITISHPESLIKNLKTNCNGYIWGCKTHAGNVKSQINYVSRIIEMTKKRGEAADYLIDKYDPSFFMIEFRGADALQHIFWNLIMGDRRSDGDYQKLQDLIFDYYRLLDKYVAILWEKYPNALKMIVSDHGFTGTDFHFYINEYLSEKGYLAKKKSVRSKAGNTYFNALKRKLHPLYNQYLTEYAIFRKMNQLRKSKLPKLDVAIDWANTQLVAKCGNGLWFNDRLDIPTHKKSELFEQVSSDFKQAKDPFSGKLLFRSIYRRDEITVDKHDDQVPDIIFEPAHESFQVLPDVALNESNVFRATTDMVFGEFTGKHRRLGAFLINRDKKSGSPNDIPVKANDVLPTVLTHMGVRVPSDMDGRVLEEYLS